MNPSPFRERLFIDAVRWAPKGTYSHVIGALARQTVPRSLRHRVYETFARRTGINLDEVELPLDEYPTLDGFFTRRLKSGIHSFPNDSNTIVSPCDGTISAFGQADAGKLIQAKGIDYRLSALLGDRTSSLRFEGGAYVTIYLAPKDYHRVHFPTDGRVTGFRHIPGALFPVNALSARHVSSLFARNERLVTYVASEFGEIAVVMVAATGVGNISVIYDAVETHSKKRGRPEGPVGLVPERLARRGDELGTFHLGSTVIVVFQPGRVVLEPLTEGQSIRLGHALAKRTSAKTPQREAV